MGRGPPFLNPLAVAEVCRDEDIRLFPSRYGDPDQHLWETCRANNWWPGYSRKKIYKNIKNTKIQKYE